MATTRHCKGGRDITAEERDISHIRAVTERSRVSHEVAGRRITECGWGIESDLTYC